jgi:hypothetical protein
MRIIKRVLPALVALFCVCYAVQNIVNRQAGYGFVSQVASMTGWQHPTGSGFPGNPVAPPAPQRVCVARHLRGPASGQLTPTWQSRLGHQYQDRQAFCDDA